MATRDWIWVGTAACIAAVIALGACGDGDVPPPPGAAALGGPASADGGLVDGARVDAILPSLGPLTVETAASVDVIAGQSVALHARLAGGAGPYRLSWEVANGAPVRIQDPASLNPIVETNARAIAMDVGLVLAVTDAHGETVARPVVLHVVPVPLTVQASAVDAVTTGQEITLHAAIDGDLDGLSVQWAQRAGDPLVVLSSGTTPNARAVLPGVTQATKFGFNFTATRANGQTATASVEVNVVPEGPIANGGQVLIGSELVVTAGDTVRLHARATNDRGARTWSWSSKSAQPAIVLTGADTANPRFVAPEVTTETELVFEVSLKDGIPTTTTATTKVRVKPRAALRAHATATANANAGARVTLGGSALGGVPSYVYEWTQTSGSAFAIEGADGPNPILVAPAHVVDESATFRLKVTDDSGVDATEDVTIAIAGAPVSAAGPEGLGPAHRSLTLVERTIAIGEGTSFTSVVCDERAPFALTTLDIGGPQGIVTTKRCVDNATCARSWRLETSPLDACVNLLPPTSASVDGVAASGTRTTCKFCCYGASCNQGIVPALGTSPACEEDVCYPAR